MTFGVHLGIDFHEILDFVKICVNHQFAFKQSISVVFVDYDKFENFMKIYAKIDTKSDPKIEVWAFRGPTFQVFGNILKNAIFYDF